MENKQLAIEYEGLKKILMEAKQEAAYTLSERNHAHKSSHYYTQVQFILPFVEFTISPPPLFLIMVYD